MTVIAIEFDTTVPSVKFFNATTGAQIGTTVTTGVPSGALAPHIGCGFPDAPGGAFTLNVGGSAFVMAPTAGYSAFNA